MFVLNFYEKCYVKLNNECVFITHFVLILCNRMHLMKEHGMNMIYSLYSMYVHGAVCM